MATVIPLTKNQVILDFNSEAFCFPKKDRLNPIVTLTFKGQQTAVTLRVSEKSFSDAALAPESPSPIEVTIEQIQSLTLKSIFFKESTIKAALPKKLEINHQYQLQIISNKTSLKARLIDEEAEILLDQKELFKFLSNKLGQFLKEGLEIFQFECSLLSAEPPPKNITTLSLRIINAIKDTIKKIDKTALKALMIMIRSSEFEWGKITPSEQVCLTKQNFRACFDVIGDANLMHLMRAVLNPSAQKFSQQQDAMINSISEEFKDKCRELVSSSHLKKQS